MKYKISALKFSKGKFWKVKTVKSKLFENKLQKDIKFRLKFSLILLIT